MPAEDCADLPHNGRTTAGIRDRWNEFNRVFARQQFWGRACRRGVMSGPCAGPAECLPPVTVLLLVTGSLLVNDAAVKICPEPPPPPPLPLLMLLGSPSALPFTPGCPSPPLTPAAPPATPRLLRVGWRQGARSACGAAAVVAKNGPQAGRSFGESSMTACAWPLAQGAGDRQRACKGTPFDRWSSRRLLGVVLWSRRC